MLSIKGNADCKFNYFSNTSRPTKSFVLEKMGYIKNLGVAIENDLSFDLNISEKVNKAFQMLG